MILVRGHGRAQTDCRFSLIGLAAQAAPRQPKSGVGTCLAPAGKRYYAARMLERKASISERSTSASRRSAPEALSTSLAADPASVEAVETPTMLLETSLVPPAAC